MTTNQVRDPTLIHFTIDGRHGILGARHIAEALHIPYEPARLEDYRVWTNPSQLEMVHTLGAEERSSARGPIQDIRGIFFGPHHLTMAALLYFEEKVHRKKLLPSGCYSTSFPRLLCQILEHLGYPSDPQLERKRICREVFTLDKWTNMTAYRAEHPELPQPQQSEDPQPAKIPAARRASTKPIHKGIPSAFPATHNTPPVIPAASEPSTSAEPRMTIPLSEYRDLCHTLQTLTATQSSLA
ncbi:hypothetical protein CK203_055189 [Vitis vinifera]|uniref:Uncharacterized protein n=1 Tax=Vitis vinifera TaxID=29760 RepID=A0A438GHX5_VITVI|nr:hypothetical protein CK203_055189 [Vitis vinifera]